MSFSQDLEQPTPLIPTSRYLCDLHANTTESNRETMQVAQVMTDMGGLFT